MTYNGRGTVHFEGLKGRGVISKYHEIMKEMTRYVSGMTIGQPYAESPHKADFYMSNMSDSFDTYVKTMFTLLPSHSKVYLDMDGLKVDISYSEYNHDDKVIKTYKVTRTFKLAHGSFLGGNTIVHMDVDLPYNASQLRFNFHYVDASDTFTPVGTKFLFDILMADTSMEGHRFPYSHVVKMIVDGQKAGEDYKVPDVPSDNGLLLTRESLFQYFKHRGIKEVFLDNEQMLTFIEESSEDIIKYTLGA